MISRVIVNHTERNYFNDYDEIRSDEMVGVEPEKVAKAIDKIHRRFKAKGECDCMLVINGDGTGWRLWYDTDPELVEKGVIQRFLRLRHFVNMMADSWDTEESVSLAYAKKAIIGGSEDGWI